MLQEIVSRITPDDRRELATYGVPSTRISEWKNNNRLPTRPQALALAHVMKADYAALERELTLLEAERANPTLFAKVQELCILCSIQVRQIWQGLPALFPA